MPRTKDHAAPIAPLNHAGAEGYLQFRGNASGGLQPRRTVRQRMEALGWSFTVDEDTCTLEIAKLVDGCARSFSCYDVAFRRDLDACAAAAEAAGDLMHT